MSAKKVMIIVNPEAGMGRGRKHVPEIKQWLAELAGEKRPEEVNIQLTSKSGGQNATNLARWAVEKKYDLVIVVGGDGTVNEAANGLAQTGMPLGIVMVGSGNDFARNLGIPEDKRKALDLAIQGDTLTVDLGKVNDRFFVNVVSVGFDAQVNYAAEALKRKLPFLPYRFIYVLALLKHLIDPRNKIEYPKLEVTIWMDKLRLGDIRREEITLVSVTNGPRYGGIFNIAPGAEFTDGLLDICLIRKMSRRRIFQNVGKVIEGTHLALPEVVKDPLGGLLKSSTIAIASSEDKTIPCQIDGEIIPPQKRYEITVLPNALRVVVPQVSTVSREMVSAEKVKEQEILCPHQTFTPIPF